MNRYANIVEKVARGYSPYRDIIMQALRRIGREEVDPRHVEAYLRMDSETGTLDDWSTAKFARVVPEVVEAIDADPRQAEKLADSYGL